LYRSVFSGKAIEVIRRVGGDSSKNPPGDGAGTGIKNSSRVRIIACRYHDEGSAILKILVALKIRLSKACIFDPGARMLENSRDAARFYAEIC